MIQVIRTYRIRVDDRAYVMPQYPAVFNTHVLVSLTNLADTPTLCALNQHTPVIPGTAFSGSNNSCTLFPRA